MGFGEAVRLFFKNYTNFQGRSRRAEYWWPVLMYVMAYVALIVVTGVGSALGDLGGILIAIAGIAYFLFALAILIPMLAVGFRRLHDTDKSAWWLLISFVPIVGSIVLLIFFVSEGTKGSNKYGPDPKGGSAVEAF